VPTPARKAASKTLHHRETPRFRRAIRLLSSRMRTLREARGWTIERAAEAYEVEPAHVRRMEAGRANPSLAVLISVAHALGVDVAELLSAP
jgi:transcriptional regulator with XRE-family HTH domain